MSPFDLRRLGLAAFEPYRGIEFVNVDNKDASVFPTGIDRRDDLGLPDRFDVYYGMADSRIGVARLELPPDLPPGAPADGDGTKAGGQE
jgi:hypothetical protein